MLFAFTFNLKCIAQINVEEKIYSLHEETVIANSKSEKALDQISALEKSIDSRFSLFFVVGGILGAFIALLEIVRTFRTDSKQLALTDEITKVISHIKTAYSDQAQVLSNTKFFLKSMEEEVAEGEINFRKISGQIEKYLKLSRMEWPALKKHELASISVIIREYSKINFRSIDNFYKGKEGKEKSKISHEDKAEIEYVFALYYYYTADIPEAEILFSNIDMDKNLKFDKWKNSQTFSKYFLGLIEKNWWNNSMGRTLQENLLSSQKRLEEVVARMNEDDSEILNYVTLAEVQSYSTFKLKDEPKHFEIINSLNKCLNDRIPKALSLLDNERDEKKKERKKANIEKLQNRCYLLMGNIYFREGNFEREKEKKDAAYSKAMQWYQKCGKNLYGLLSLGLVKVILKIDGKGSQEFNQIKEELNEAKSIEIGTSGTLLAWQVISTSTLDKNRKSEDLTKLKDFVDENENLVQDMIPLFFCPIKKELVDGGDLYENISEFVSSLKL